MRRRLLLGTLLAAGCAETAAPPGSPAVIETPVAVLPVPAPTPPPPAAKLTPVVMPTDLGGRAVSQALMPGLDPISLPVTAGPKPRESELDRGEIPIPMRPIVLPPSGMPEAKPARLSPPKERVPSDMGSRPTMKIQAVIRGLAKAPTVVNPGAADVGPLVRVVPDKAGVDDPTADLLAAAVIATAFPAPAEALPFARFTLPDPFEYAGHLKGKLPREAEFRHGTELDQSGEVGGKRVHQPRRLPSNPLPPPRSARNGKDFERISHDRAGHIQSVFSPEGTAARSRG